MDFDYYRKYFSEGSVGRYDMAPLYADPDVFMKLVDDIILPFRKDDIDGIIALDATGFILGAAAATVLKRALILARKGGKIPLPDDRKLTEEFIDYTGKKKSLEMDIGMISSGGAYLVVDDWVETGTQARAVIRMVEKCGGRIIGISAIGADRNPETEELFTRYRLHAIGVDV